MTCNATLTLFPSRVLTLGQTTKRLLVDRAIGASKSKGVVVWDVAFLSDHTIISGDSAGKVQIWDGLTGTLIRTHLVTKWDVLVLSVSQVRVSPPYQSELRRTLTCSQLNGC